MTYDGGSLAPQSSRPIIPLCWVTKNSKFKAVCVNTSLEKEYFLHKVMDLSYQVPQGND